MNKDERMEDMNEAINAQRTKGRKNEENRIHTNLSLTGHSRHRGSTLDKNQGTTSTLAPGPILPLTHRLQGSFPSGQKSGA